MSIFYNPYDLCPCESGLKAKFCCLNEKSWDKKPAVLAGKTLITNYSHNKCYANKTKDCSSKISKEHYISEYLLNNLGNTDNVNISGLHWQGFGQVKTMSKAALASNILCTHHNEMLSPFDAEMGRFHSTINRYNQTFDLQIPLNELVIFCGENLEKWILKTICAFIASNQIGVGDKKIDCQMSDTYIDILFKDKPFPEGWGMYVDASNDQTIQYHNYISFNFIIRDNILQVAKMVLTGLTFYLVLDKPESMKPEMIYRPRGIEIKKGDIKKILEICWQDKKYDQGVFLTHQRDITHTKLEWDNLIFNK